METVSYHGHLVRFHERPHETEFRHFCKNGVEHGQMHGFACKGQEWLLRLMLVYFTQKEVITVSSPSFFR